MVFLKGFFWKKVISKKKKKKIYPHTTKKRAKLPSMQRVNIRCLDTLGRLSAIFHEGDDFCVFLYTFLIINTLVRLMPFFTKETLSVTSCLLPGQKVPSKKRSALKGKNLFGSQFITFRLYPFPKREKINFELPTLKVQPFPLTRFTVKELESIPAVKNRVV